MASVAVIILTGLVPAIVQVYATDNMHIAIRANVPIDVIGVVYNCDEDLITLPIDTICNFEGPIVVRARE